MFADKFENKEKVINLKQPINAKFLRDGLEKKAF